MKKTPYLFVIFALLMSGFVTNAVAEEDQQYVLDDEYFISTEVFKNQDWIRVTLAKQQKAPSKETKNEDQYIQTGDGKTLWTKNFWKTGPALPEELKLGQIIIVLDAADENGLYRTPENRDEAMTGSWFMAKVTDLSDLYKDIVTVSGGYKVKKDALRALLTEKK